LWKRTDTGCGHLLPLVRDATAVAAAAFGQIVDPGAASPVLADEQQSPPPRSSGSWALIAAKPCK